MRVPPNRWAVQQGHHDFAAALLEGKGIVECEEHIPRWTSLPYATSNGRLDIIRFVFSENHLELNLEDDDGHMALELAVSNGQDQSVVELLSRGAMIPGRRVEYLIALEQAARRGYSIVIGHMIDAGIDLKDSIYGCYGLRAAVRGRHYPVIERLLIAGVKPDIRVTPGAPTLLQEAAADGYEIAVERLLQAGADVNAPCSKDTGWTALDAAVMGGHSAVIDRLLVAGAYSTRSVNGLAILHEVAQEVGHGADVQKLFGVANNESRTALELAAEAGHDSMIQWLLSAGAEVNTRNLNWPALTALRAAAEGGHAVIVERLLEAGANVNTRASSDTGYTALQAAAENGHGAIVERLLQAGANRYAAGRFGCTAVERAAVGGHIKIVERLLADVGHDPGYSDGALVMAAQHGHEQIVMRLLTAGAEVNIPGRRSGSALQVAARHGHEQIVIKLLTAGADVNAPRAEMGTAVQLESVQLESRHRRKQRVPRRETSRDRVNPWLTEMGTALQLASEHGHEQIVISLLTAGADVNVPGERGQQHFN